MTSIVKFTPISGAQNEGPCCYLLEVDQFKLLLDCGWTEQFDVDQIRRLKDYAPHIDAVLLSHPDLAHLGALPYAFAKLGLDCAVYATTPVSLMGQMFLYDAWKSRQLEEDFELFTPDDIEAAFSRVVDLKYQQSVRLLDRSTGSETGITIEAHHAGHMIGGAVFRIWKDEAEDVVYAVDYNHRKERHLPGSVLESLARPYLLITDSLNSTYSQPKQSETVQKMLGEVQTTLRRDGDVLVMTDTAGRVLEILQVFERTWAKNPGLSVYKLVLLTACPDQVIEHARTNVEFMSKQIKEKMEQRGGENPFDLRHVTRITSMDDLRIIPGKKVILCSQDGLSSGLGREIFIRLAGNKNNAVCFTGRPPPGTLGRRLVDVLWRVIDKAEGLDLTLKHRTRIPLRGAELEAFLDEKRRKEEEEAAKAEALAAEEAALEEDADTAMFGADDDDDDDDDGDFAASALARHDLMAPQITKAGQEFFKQAKAFDMYPCVDRRPHWDEYGEVIRPEDFMVEDPREAAARAEEAAAAERQAAAEAAAARGPEEIPTKVISRDIRLQVRCRMWYSEFEGRSDGNSIKNILKQVTPRNLIVIHGTSEATDDLVEFCATDDDIAEHMSNVFSPAVGERVDVTSERNIFQLKLTDSLVSSLKFSEVGGYSVAWIDGMVGMADDATSAGADAGEAAPAMDEYEEAAAVMEEDAPDIAIPVLTAPTRSDLTGHRSVFIARDPKLSHLKEVLSQNGIRTHFSGGMLICEDTVAVRMVAPRGQPVSVSIEGNICETYYHVRELLYEQFAIV
mmetsp:Transcript_30814/g.80643  ORF Transcript_30814/g.80643 Transcript_30814/m.80643 type:complete len:792 (+) Transcript_30814:220-2595(+)